MKVGDCLVIADLHIGITKDIWEKEAEEIFV